MPQLMSADDVRRALHRIAHEILERHRGVEDVVLVGIQTRGAHLAQFLRDAILDFENVTVPLGDLDITPFRDDRPQVESPPPVTELPFDVADRSVILVDDVLYTGRTVRAAMDAISELGRAAQIELAVLIDRGHRELPVRPDYVGKNTPTSHQERISVHVEHIDGDLGVWIQREGS